MLFVNVADALLCQDIGEIKSVGIYPVKKMRTDFF